MSEFIFPVAFFVVLLLDIVLTYLNQLNLKDFRKRIKADEEMIFRLADSTTQNGKDILRLHAEINERLKILEERKKPGRKKKTGTGEQGEIKK